VPKTVFAVYDADKSEKVRKDFCKDFVKQLPE
jgi:hypothetical protein